MLHLNLKKHLRNNIINPYHKWKYTLTSIPTYDSLGNVYQVNKNYDHIPTSKDSADFLKESRISIHKMIDSFYNTNIEKAKFIKTKQKKKKKFQCVLNQNLVMNKAIEERIL